MEPWQFKVEGSTMNFPQIQLIHDVASSSMSQPSNPASAHVPANPTAIEQHVSTSSVPSSAPPAPPRLPEHLMHKNRLQEFAQRSNIALPMYQTTNEGSPHAPRFRSTVWVDGMSYTSPVTFSQRKAAEQDVARLALLNLMKRIKDEEYPLVSENTLFLSKSILNEYATKLSVERPMYNTIQLEGLLPHFQSSIVFNGTKYTGDTARNKKEAEQLAARAAILSILGGSSPGTLCEIIKSKSKIYAATLPNKSQSTDANTASATASTGHASSLLDHKDKEVPSVVACNNDVAKIELPVSSIMPFTSQECKMPVHVPAPEATKLSNLTPACQELQIPVHVPAPEATKLSNLTPAHQELQIPAHVPAPEATKLPNVSLQPGGSEQPQQGIANASSSKKRRKNKKKANKKSRLEAPSPQAVIPCSVAQ